MEKKTEVVKIISLLGPYKFPSFHVRDQKYEISWANIVNGGKMDVKKICVAAVLKSDLRLHFMHEII